jgi:hypothetical protein
MRRMKPSCSWRYTHVDENDRIRLQVCSALLTNHRAQLEKALDIPVEIIGNELHAAVIIAVSSAPIPGNHGLVKMTMYLPAWVQYVGQRGVLLFPKLASRLLRSSGLHHQMF